MEEEEKRKELKVIAGDGTGLNISRAYEHVKDEEPDDIQSKKPKNIIVPKEISKKGGKKKDE